MLTTTGGDSCTRSLERPSTEGRADRRRSGRGGPACKASVWLASTGKRVRASSRIVKERFSARSVVAKEKAPDAFE
jgi:hypothetical protein